MTFDKSKLVVKKEVSISYDSPNGAFTREINHNQTDLMIDVSEVGCVELSHLEAIVEEFKSLREQLRGDGVIYDSAEHNTESGNINVKIHHTFEPKYIQGHNPFATKQFVEKCKRRAKKLSVISPSRVADNWKYIVHATDADGGGWFHCFDDLKRLKEFDYFGHGWSDVTPEHCVEGIFYDDNMDDLYYYWKDSVILIRGDKKELMEAGLLHVDCEVSK